MTVSNASVYGASCGPALETSQVPNLALQPEEFISVPKMAPVRNGSSIYCIKPVVTMGNMVKYPNLNPFVSAIATIAVAISALTIGLKPL